MEALWTLALAGGWFAKSYEKHVKPMNFEVAPTDGGGSPGPGEDTGNVVALSQKK